MDFYNHGVRSSSVEEERRANKQRKWVMETGNRCIGNKSKKEGVMKIIDEIKYRKDRGLGDGSSLYLKRRYNLQKQGREAIFTPDRKDRLNQTQQEIARMSSPTSPMDSAEQFDPLSPRNNEPPKQSARNPYHDKLIVTEDAIEKKVKIPKAWEKDPLTDRNYYMRSPQYKFSVKHGDFDNGRYQSRYMNRRFKQQDSFSKVIPTYHHQKESSYVHNLSQSHRTHHQISRDDLGRNLADIDLRNFKKTDFLQGYADMIWCMPELAP